MCLIGVGFGDVFGVRNCIMPSASILLCMLCTVSHNPQPRIKLIRRGDDTKF